MAAVRQTGTSISRRSALAGCNSLITVIRGSVSSLLPSPPISSHLLPSSSLRKHWDQPPGWMQGKPLPTPLGLSSPWTSSSWKVKYIEDYTQELSPHTLPPHTRHVSTSVPQKTHSHQASLCLPHKPGQLILVFTSAYNKGLFITDTLSTSPPSERRMTHCSKVFTKLDKDRDSRINSNVSSYISHHLKWPHARLISCCVLYSTYAGTGCGYHRRSPPLHHS